MEDTEALRETREMLIRLERETNAEIEGLEKAFGTGNPMLRLLLKSLSVTSDGDGDDGKDVPEECRIMLNR